MIFVLIAKNSIGVRDYSDEDEINKLGLMKLTFNEMGPNIMMNT